MKWLEITIFFEFADKALGADLIADMFTEMGLQGAVIMGAAEAESSDWADDRAPEDQADAVKGYIVDDAEAADKLDRIEQEMRLLQDRTGMQWRLTQDRLDDQDWAEAWKAHFYPMRIGASRFVIKPSWREYEAQDNDIILEIDPGMAFGTGAHPTTAMCVELIARHIQPNDRFLDIGVGSGILMLAAARMGAAELCGVDNEAVAIDVARENLQLNHVPEQQVRLWRGDLADKVADTFDLVSANILSDVILALAPDLHRVLKPDGHFIASGITQGNLARVLAGMQAAGLTVVEIWERDQWAAVVAGWDPAHG